MSWLANDSVGEIKGVGEVSFNKLQAAGLKTKLDLINYLPRDYQSINFINKLANVQPGQITIVARAENINLRRTNRALTVLQADLLDDDGDKIQAVWFNQPYRQNQLRKGKFYFSGTFEFTRGRYQLTNPSVVEVRSASKQLADNRIQPIYPSTRGLKSSFFEKIIKNLAGEIMLLDESLPAVVVEKLELPERSDAYYQLHFPASIEQLDQAKRRYQVENYFVAELASYINGEQYRQLMAESVETDLKLIKQALSKLSFQLTDDQRKVLWAVLQDLAATTPMNRLIQGDVGSGKTIVAILAALNVAKAGGQVAIMAPTEILAKQHFANFEQLLSQFNIKTSLLIGALKPKAKTELQQQIAAGEIQVVVGTHSLVQDKLEFANLQLAVIDEQHRFGVDQRQKLLQKAKDSMPHLLSMTATPIPRSLALVLKHELKISSIRQKPAGRQPITTQIIDQNKRDLVYQDVARLLDKGQQAYVVCGLIDETEETEETERQSVETVFERVKARDLPGKKIAMLHGKMPSDQKDQIMTDFQKGEYDVLVSTTVIEVGIDVPNATAMVIEDAKFYGLSQLHQLRGRIGRGDHPSFCWLIADDQAVTERLKAIERSNDGFYLAEMDLKLRGMGDLYGRAQHGWFSLQADLAALEQAEQGLKAYVDDLRAKDLTLAADLKNYPDLARAVADFDQLTMLN